MFDEEKREDGFGLMRNKINHFFPVEEEPLFDEEKKDDDFGLMRRKKRNFVLVEEKKELQVPMKKEKESAWL